MKSYGYSKAQQRSMVREGGARGWALKARRNASHERGSAGALTLRMAVVMVYKCRMVPNLRILLW